MLIELTQMMSGALLLFLGAEALVKGASRLAALLGMQPILIGLTLVAFGTSAPEAVVSIYAALGSSPDIAAGNVIGSNIFNIGVILGLSALIRPLKADQLSLKREIPFVILSAALVWFLGRDGVLGRGDGLVFLILFAVFMWFCFSMESGAKQDGGEQAKGGRTGNALLAAAGVLLLVAGARFFVTGSAGIARAAGISELVIGLTLIAAGTSLPELATSVVAAIRRQDDLAVGNVSGSNIFNILFILGFVALVQPVPVAASLIARDIPVMILLSLAVVPVIRTGFIINRAEGLLLIAAYGAYLFWLLRGA